MSEQSEQPKPKYSPEYQEMLDAVPGYMKRHEIPQDRFLFWVDEAKRVLNENGSSFEFYENGNEELIKTGDGLMLKRMANGYNILLGDRDMDIASTLPLVFYNCHIGRTWHLGLLLAEMEKEQLITPKRVGFGKKATKVNYGGWKVVSEDEFPDVITDGKSQKSVLKTVETVLTFRPKGDAEIIAIVGFLLEKTVDRGDNDCIPGSWEIQDLRGTIALKRFLDRAPFLGNFGLAVSNVFKTNKTSLIVLREEKRLEDMKSWHTVLNIELIKFLSMGGVGK